MLLVEAARRIPVEHVEVDALVAPGRAFLGQRRISARATPPRRSSGTTQMSSMKMPRAAVQTE